jgi:hypothetical protein
MRTGQPRVSVTKEFFKLRARRRFTQIIFGLGFPDAADELKILAEISGGFFQHRIGAALAAFLRHAQIITRAVQAHAQIRATFHADLAATWLAGKDPRLAAIVAMSRHFNLRLMICDLRLPK